MENDPLALLAPKSFEEVLEAYVKTWQQPQQEDPIPSPALRLHLQEGHVIEGELIHVDFEKRQISLRSNLMGKKSVLYFVGLADISYFGLLDWEECGEFLRYLGEME